MKDLFGHQRGSCLKCKECEEFKAVEGEIRCAQCGCTPVDHEKVLKVEVESKAVDNPPDNHEKGKFFYQIFPH